MKLSYSMFCLQQLIVDRACFHGFVKNVIANNVVQCTCDFFGTKR